MKQVCSFFLLAILFASCKSAADLVVYNAKVYTVNENFDTAQAFAVRKGKFIAAGTSASIRNKFKAARQIDAQGKTVYPGFIDAHAHFFGYAQSLQSVDLVGTESWDEVIGRVAAFAKTHPDGWLIGEGWDQNDWQVKEFPDNSQLTALFPNRPVLLRRVDGHAAVANRKALELADLRQPRKIDGGDMGTREGRLTGLLVDNAVDLVQNHIPQPDTAQIAKMLHQAEQNCFAVGLTTIDDCGLDYELTQYIDALQQAGRLKMRMYILLSDAQKNYDYLFKRGAVKTDRLNIRGFKVYADGALGSRGACLLQPYSDAPHNYGFLLNPKDHYREVAEKIAAHGFQMCTHAIGDSGNRWLLTVYNDVLKGKNDRRWRIEHAQVINENDFGLFAKASIIPSVQPTHATSDMYWAGDRLGKERLKGAYAYKRLMQQNGWIALGTDFPVEDISPIKTFYAATIRKDAKGYPEGGFQMENALSPEQTLRGMTIWAAKANFEEKEKGSIEKGKVADFVILDRDLITALPEDILQAKVLATYLNGENVYQR